MPVEIVFKSSVEKDLKSIPLITANRILLECEKLVSNPFPANAKKLGGTHGLYRIRSGDYRIIYSVDVKKSLLTVHYVRHRKDAYRNL